MNLLEVAQEIGIPIERLRFKARKREVQAKACPGHVYDHIDWSQIKWGEGSATCVHCGDRQDISNILPGQWKAQTKAFIDDP